MAAQNLSNLIDELLPQFETLHGTIRTAQRTLKLSHRFFNAAREAELEACGADGGLEGRMLALAEALNAWAPQTAAGLAAMALGGDQRPPWMPQLMAAYRCLAALAVMARRMGVQPAAAFRIAATCQMVFETGAFSNTILAARVEAEAAAEQETPEAMLAFLTLLSMLQLEAVSACIVLLQQDGLANVAAAFARSTAKPATLVPWLRQAARAVSSLRSWLQQPDDSGCALIRAFTTLLSLLFADTFVEHAAVIVTNPAAQEAVAGALLASCLPYLATEFGTAAAAGLPPSSHQHVKALCSLCTTLQHLRLASGVAQHMQAPGAADTLRHAAGVVAAAAALPRDLPAGSEQHNVLEDVSFLDMHLCAAGLLAACCNGLSQSPAAASNGSSGGSDSSGSSSGDTAADGDRLALAWELVAAVPHMCSSVRTLTHSAAADDFSSLKVQARIVSSYGVCFSQLLVKVLSVPCSAAQLTAWAAAAEASMRLQPVLVQLDAALQQLPDDSPERQAMRLLACQLVCVLSSCPALLEGGSSGSSAAADPATAALRRQLCQTHLAGCRLAHWLSQQETAGRAMDVYGPMGMSAVHLTLLNGLSRTLMRLLQLDPSGLSARLPPAVTQAACSAHVVAAGALAAMAAAALPADGSSQGLEAGLVPEVAAALASSLQLALQAVPSLAGPAALAPVEALLPVLPQSNASSRAALAEALAQDQTVGARWTAALAGSGLLAAGVDAAASLSFSGEASSVALAGQTLDRVAEVLNTLDVEATAMLGGGADASLPESLAAQLGTAVSSLREQRQAGLGAVQADAPPAEHVAQLRPLLPPAADLAALMQQCYALPAVDKPHRLELAQAAAGRCCAYLRCANVEGQGGPAARQGTGSKCCSACRAVWYCGTACSHADWRAGHKHVCKALGEARLAAKEARRAARSDPAAAAEEQARDAAAAAEEEEEQE